jgi:hypothetical protein
MFVKDPIRFEELKSLWYQRKEDMVRNKKDHNLSTSRGYIIKYKESNPVCIDCKIDYPAYVLDFDHLPIYTKNFALSYAGVRGRTIEAIDNEIKKCEIICSNCHRYRTHLRFEESIFEVSKHFKPMLDLNSVGYRDEILRLSAEGFSYNGISKALGCSKGTISYHLGKGQIEKTNVRRKKYKKGIAEYLQDLKSNTPCVDCNFTYFYWAMDFDHVRGEKYFRIGQYSNKVLSLKMVKEEVAKCELVCSNCHRHRTCVRRNEKRIIKSRI